MKKVFLTAAFCSVLMLLTVFYASASVPVITDSVAPPVAEYDRTDTDSDITVSVSYSVNAEECEAVRRTYLSQLLKTHTYEEIENSASAWILHETKLFCEASGDGICWYTVRILSPGTGKTELSLMNDILPSMKKNGADLTRKYYGFDLKLRFILASDDYSFSSDNTVFVISAPSATYGFHCPEFTFIDIDTPDGTVFPQHIPQFMFYPNTEQITLCYPQLQGYTFAGWQKSDGSYTETIPEKTRYRYIKAVWEPCVYAVNYILATNLQFNFGRADNSKNPTSYTFGEITPLQALRSPAFGYSFDGWYLSSDFSGDPITEIPEDSFGDILIYAKWISDKDKELRDKDKNEAYAMSLHYGDIDLDGKITSADARLALRASVGLEALSSEAAKRADIFDTGVITSANARSILRVSVGLDSLYTILTFYGIIMPERDIT